jgi:hypothetical protein
MNKITSHLHMFWWFFKSKTIWIKFPIFNSPKILPYFYFLFSFSVLAYQYYFSYLSTNLIFPAIFFHRPRQQFGPTTYSGHRPNLLWSSSTSPTTVPLFAVSSTFDTMELPRLLPLFPSKNGRTHRPHSPFSSPITGAIEVPPSLYPSLWLLTFCCPMTL